MLFMLSFVQAEKLTTLIKAAGVDVEPFWPDLFSKALEGQYSYHHIVTLIIINFVPINSSHTTST